MNREKIKQRLDDLKKENDNLNSCIEQLNTEKSRIVQRAIQNNGAIIELNKLLNEFTHDA